MIMNIKKRVQRQFSLIEILVVMVIILVLMSIALPAFSTMMRGAGVEGAGRNLCQILKLARSHAINNREHVAVLFPKDTLDDKYLNRSYRVCIVMGSTGSYTFKRWIPSEEWAFLPVGIAIFDIDELEVANNANTFISAEDISSVNCDDIGMVLETIKGIVFKSNGKTSKTAPTFIGIGDGVVSGGNLILTNIDQSGNPANVVNITIDQYTGRISYGSE